MLPRSTVVVVLSSMLGVAALVTAPIAVAKDDDPPVVRGSACSEDSWKRLRVDPDGEGRLVVTGTVWSGDDDLWVWRMIHDGDISARGEARADGDADRSFRVRRTMLDFPGTDVIAFRADNNRTGETCFAKIDDEF